MQKGSHSQILQVKSSPLSLLEAWVWLTQCNRNIPTEVSRCLELEGKKSSLFLKILYVSPGKFSNLQLGENRQVQDLKSGYGIRASPRCSYRAAGRVTTVQLHTAAALISQSG